jgi:hypothetical protein
LTVTTTLLDAAPVGSATVIAESLHDLTESARVPIFTVLEPCELPNVVPLMTNPIWIGPVLRDKVLICGVTANVIELLLLPPTVTITGPVEAPAGTFTAMLVLLQLVGDAGTELKRTVLVLCVAPNPDPVIVTAVSTGPSVTDRLEMLGAAKALQLAASKTNDPNAICFHVAAILPRLSLHLRKVCLATKFVLPLSR